MLTFYIAETVIRVARKEPYKLQDTFLNYALTFWISYKNLDFSIKLLLFSKKMHWKWKQSMLFGWSCDVRVDLKRSIHVGHWDYVDMDYGNACRKCKACKTNTCVLKRLYTTYLVKLFFRSTYHCPSYC